MERLWFRSSWFPPALIVEDRSFFVSPLLVRVKNAIFLPAAEMSAAIDVQDLTGDCGGVG